ncbi:MAG: retropepsin-like aspartic protease [bacterium]
MSKVKTYSFTVNYPHLVNTLFTQAFISCGFEPKGISTSDHPEMEVFNALWDTGASNSVITKNIVKKCKLEPIGRTKVNTANGTMESLVYMINMGLPNHVGISYLKVTEGILHKDIDLLIGMDVINRGDFVITNSDKKTTFSFRMPSIEVIDFVKQTKK